MSTYIVSPGTGKKFSREEGFWRLMFSLNEEMNKRANIIDMINYIEQKLVFRTIEVGNGLEINVVNTNLKYPDGNYYRKIVISNTQQEGVNVKVNDINVGTQPAKTINFSGPFSATQTTPGEIKVTFEGNLLTGIDVRENGILVSGSPFNTINFITPSGSSVFSVSAGIVNVDLTNIGGFNQIDNFVSVYTGPTMVSGQLVVSGFFGTNTPDPKSIIVTINGLVLEYNDNPLLSDFQVSGNDLILNVDSLNFSLESNDKIQAYYWIIT
jgi:hypothetical protein